MFDPVDDLSKINDTLICLPIDNYLTLVSAFNVSIREHSSEMGYWFWISGEFGSCRHAHRRL